MQENSPDQDEWRTFDATAGITIPRTFTAMSINSMPEILVSVHCRQEAGADVVTLIANESSFSMTFLG